jgi:plasmid stability protein
MAQVLIRNLDDVVVARLKRRAQRHGRRLEQELREILTRAAMPTRAEVLAEIDRIRAMTPPGQPIDSTALIRENRDSR